ncbi:MAG: AAA family ATPase [Candidatus Omnitrophica bacterium]|nr:AAA family ATPase [Candidatus Omnitrophota bacterium]
MYERHWNLKEKPFENTPDPRFFYLSSQHSEALARMLYAVREKKGAALFTGEYGSGKTLLSRVLWHELQQEDKYQPIFILNPRLKADEFVVEIVHQLGGENSSREKIDLFHSLHKLLYHNYEMNRHTVIVIDEAQAIYDKEVFEELRLLLNFQLENTFLLTVILMGQPELRDMVVELPQLFQRLSVRYHLKALDENETKEYIRHRLKVAGAGQDIFTDDAHREIYLHSQGIPRKINNLCDLALLAGFSRNLNLIDQEIILKVHQDIKIEDTTL